MLFRSSSLLVLAAIAAPTVSALGFGGRRGGEEAAPSDDTGYYTPAGEFYVYTNGQDMYLPNREDSFSYLHSYEDEVRMCTVGACTGEGSYLSTSVLGRDIENGFVISVAVDDDNELTVACPFGNMEISVIDAYCADTPEISRLENVTWTEDGILLDSITYQESCAVPEGINDVYAVYDIACTAKKESDFPLMQEFRAARKEKSYGRARQFPTRANIGFVYTSSFDDKATWVDGITTTLEFFGSDDGDDGYCTATMCSGEYYSVYIHSPDPNTAILYSNSDFSSIEIICPYGDQIPSATLHECKSSDVNPMVTSIDIEGPFITSISENCTAPVVAIEVVCSDP